MGDLSSIGNSKEVGPFYIPILEILITDIQ